MKQISHNHYRTLFGLGMLMSSALLIQARERQKLVGQKEGINLYVSFVEPVDRNNPAIAYTLENTGDIPVPFLLQGSKEGPGFGLRLVGEDGREIPKTEQWVRHYETGDSFHERYGTLRPGIPVTYVFELEKAFGQNWISGVRLDVDWNSRESRKENGFGVGSGVSGSINISSLTTRGFEPNPESEEPSHVEKPSNTKPASDKGADPYAQQKTRGESINLPATLFPKIAMYLDPEASLTVWVSVGFAVFFGIALSVIIWAYRKRS